MTLKGVQQTKSSAVLLLISVIIIFPFLINTSYYITQATFAGIYAIVAIGLGLLMGYAGQISLGQAGFYGIGAYTTAILSTTYGWNPWLSLLLSVILPGMLAYIMGYTMSRLSGYYLAMATLALGIIVYTFLLELKTITKGATGLYGIPPIKLFNFTFMPGVNYFYLVWFFVIFVLIISLNIVHSRIGRALRSIHDSEIASSSMGVNTGKYKMMIFIFSAMLAGLAGWLFAHMSYSISPSVFTLDESILFLTMVVLGGSSSVWGALLGAILVRIIGIIVFELGQTFTFITSDTEQILFGLILICVVIFMPRGLYPTMKKALKRKKTNINIPTLQK